MSVQLNGEDMLFAAGGLILGLGAAHIVASALAPPTPTLSNYAYAYATAGKSKQSHATKKKAKAKRKAKKSAAGKKKSSAKKAHHATSHKHAAAKHAHKAAAHKAKSSHKTNSSSHKHTAAQKAHNAASHAHAAAKHAHKAANHAKAAQQHKAAGNHQAAAAHNNAAQQHAKAAQQHGQASKTLATKTSTTQKAGTKSPTNQGKPGARPSIKPTSAKRAKQISKAEKKSATFKRNVASDKASNKANKAAFKKEVQQQKLSKGLQKQLAKPKTQALNKSFSQRVQAAGIPSATRQQQAATPKGKAPSFSVPKGARAQDARNLKQLAGQVGRNAQGSLIGAQKGINDTVSQLEKTRFPGQPHPSTFAPVTSKGRVLNNTGQLSSRFFDSRGQLDKRVIAGQIAKGGGPPTAPNQFGPGSNIPRGGTVPTGKLSSRFTGSQSVAKRLADSRGLNASGPSIGTSQSIATKQTLESGGIASSIPSISPGLNTTKSDPILNRLTSSPPQNRTGADLTPSVPKRGFPSSHGEVPIGQIALGSSKPGLNVIKATNNAFTPSAQGKMPTTSQLISAERKKNLGPSAFISPASNRFGAGGFPDPNAGTGSGPAGRAFDISPVSKAFGRQFISGIKTQPGVTRGVDIGGMFTDNLHSHNIGNVPGGFTNAPTTPNGRVLNATSTEHPLTGKVIQRANLHGMGTTALAGKSGIQVGKLASRFKSIKNDPRFQRAMVNQMLKEGHNPNNISNALSIAGTNANKALKSVPNVPGTFRGRTVTDQAAANRQRVARFRAAAGNSPGAQIAQDAAINADSQKLTDMRQITKKTGSQIVPHQFDAVSHAIDKARQAEQVRIAKRGINVGNQTSSRGRVFNDKSGVGRAAAENRPSRKGSDPVGDFIRGVQAGFNHLFGSGGAGGTRIFEPSLVLP